MDDRVSGFIRGYERFPLLPIIPEKDHPSLGRTCQE
jgi:hypothetical protein